MFANGGVMGNGCLKFPEIIQIEIIKEFIPRVDGEDVISEVLLQMFHVRRTDGVSGKNLPPSTE